LHYNNNIIIIIPP